MHFDLYGFGALPDAHGLNGISTLVERVTGFCRFIPMRNRSAREIIRVLTAWCDAYGVPDVFQSDNERSLESEEVREFFRVKGVEVFNTGAYYKEGNGQAERDNRSLGQVLKTLAGAERIKKVWPSWLHIVEEQLNFNVNTTTKVVPFVAAFGRWPKLSVDMGRQRELSTAEWQKVTESCAEGRRQAVKEAA